MWAIVRTLAESSAATQLMLYAPQVLFGIPLPFLAVWALIARDRRSLGLQAIAAMLVAGPVMGFCVPWPGSGRSDHKLRVMTFNVDGLSAGGPAVLEEIRRAGPDLLLMVEAFDETLTNPMYGQLRATQPTFGEYHTGEFYMWSRYPIRPLGAEYEISSGAAVEIAAPFGSFRLIGVHLGHDRVTNYAEYRLRRLVRPATPPDMRTHTANRQREVSTMLPWMDAGDQAVLMMGDFNTPPVGPVYGLVGTRLGDAFAAAGLGWGYTYPARLPLLRIDQIHISRQWVPRRLSVGGGRASDHRPLIADLEFIAG